MQSLKRKYSITVSISRFWLWDETISDSFYAAASYNDSVMVRLQPFGRLIVFYLKVTWYTTIKFGCGVYNTNSTGKFHFDSIPIPLFAPDELNTLGNRLLILHQIYCILHKVFSTFTLHSMQRTDNWFFPPFLWVGSFIDHELLSVMNQYRSSWRIQIRISKIRLLHFSTHSCSLLLRVCTFPPT